MTSDEFFGQRFEWSRWKHDILKKYLHVWVSKLGYRSPVLAYIDGCAGAGTYGGGVDGSPRLAAKWNDDFLRAKGRRLVVLACEQRPDSAARLREALAPWTSRTPPEAVVLETSFVDALPALLEQTRAVPTFIFIDPYGMRSITADELRPLLKDRDREPTELLLRVDPGLLARFSGWLKKKQRSAKAQRTAEAFRQRLIRYNISEEMIGEIEAEDAEAPVGGRDVVLFRRYLELFEERFRYVQIIPIRPSYFAAPKYFLVHGTDSPHGAAKINDAVSTTEDSLFTETLTAEDTRAGQGSLFDPPTRPPRASRQDAQAVIIEHLADGRAHKWIRVRAALALRFGPDLRERDHRAALADLRGRHQVEIINADASQKINDRTVVRRRVTR